MRKSLKKRSFQYFWIQIRETRNEMVGKTRLSLSKEKPEGMLPVQRFIELLA